MGWRCSCTMVLERERLVVALSPQHLRRSKSSQLLNGLQPIMRSTLSQCAISSGLPIQWDDRHYPTAQEAGSSQGGWLHWDCLVEDTHLLLQSSWSYQTLAQETGWTPSKHAPLCLTRAVFTTSCRLCRGTRDVGCAINWLHPCSSGHWWRRLPCLCYTWGRLSHFSTDSSGIMVMCNAFAQLLKL